LRASPCIPINFSEVLEQRLIELLPEKKRRKRREENRDSIEAYNRRIEARGVFKESLQ